MTAKERAGFLSKLTGSAGGDSREEAADRRASKRVELPIPVRLQVGDGEETSRRLRDISLHGLCLEGPLVGSVDEVAVVYFAGYPDICDPFFLVGHVARVIEEAPGAVAIKIDRGATPPSALVQFRKLVLHYLRHRPLLEEIDAGFFEGRCEACGWIGRVGERKPSCSVCGASVVPRTD